MEHQRIMFSICSLKLKRHSLTFWSKTRARIILLNTSLVEVVALDSSQNIKWMHAYLVHPQRLRKLMRVNQSLIPSNQLQSRLLPQRAKPDWVNLYLEVVALSGKEPILTKLAGKGCKALWLKRRSPRSLLTSLRRCQSMAASFWVQKNSYPDLV